MKKLENAVSAIQSALSDLEDNTLETIIFAQTKNQAWSALHIAQRTAKIQKKLCTVLLDIERLDDYRYED